MATGRSQPSIVIDVQVLVTHAASVAPREQEMGLPPRLIRAPDVGDLFQTRDEERLPGLVDRWAAYGLAAQVVFIPPMAVQSTRSSHPTPASCQAPAGRDPSTPTTGPTRQTGPRMARPATGETL